MTFKLLTLAKETFLELLFPLKCIVCEKETREKRKNKLICTDCLQNLSPSLNFFCPLCEAKTFDGKLCFSCLPPHSSASDGGNLIINNNRGNFHPDPEQSREDSQRASASYGVDRLLHPFSYNDPAIQKAIKAFKYYFIKGLEAPLGLLMAGYLNKIKGRVDLNDLIVVPVPLHKRKFNQRGYNQSELITGQISKSLNLEVAGGCLQKTKSTEDQARLKESKRKGNLKGAFVCLKPELISGKRILLVDDVYTTGTTMAECAKVLKEAGAKEVIGLVIARG